MLLSGTRLRRFKGRRSVHWSASHHLTAVEIEDTHKDPIVRECDRRVRAGDVEGEVEHHGRAVRTTYPGSWIADAWPVIGCGEI